MEKEESIVRTLLETIHPSIRCYLQTGTFETVAVLILRAERVQDNIEATRSEEVRPTRGSQKAPERQAQRAIAPTADPATWRGAARFPSKGHTDEIRPYDRHPREAPPTTVVPILPRTALPPRLPQGKGESGKLRRGTGGGDGPGNRRTPPPIKISSASNPGATNISLSVIINGREIPALVGSGATENFANTRILSADITLHPHTSSHVLLAGEVQQMKVEGACDLQLTVAGLTEKAKFLVSPSLRFNLVLGRRWLKENRVVHDHDLDCLYLGRDTRRRVFLGQAPRAIVAQPRVKRGRVRDGFPETHRAELQYLLDRHADVFDDSGPLR
jgi:hypothetical protein